MDSFCMLSWKADTVEVMSECLNVAVFLICFIGRASDDGGFYSYNDCEWKQNWTGNVWRANPPAALLLLCVDLLFVDIELVINYCHLHLLQPLHNVVVATAD